MGKQVAKLKIICARSMHEVVGALAYDFTSTTGHEVELDFGTVGALQKKLDAGEKADVLISSIGGIIGIPFQAFYSASKFALEGFAEALAYEVAPLGVQVTKEAGRKFIEAGERAAIDSVPTIRQRVMGTADAAEGIASFVERRAAVFQGR